MSTLSRYARPIDGTIPVPALLYDDEQLLASQDGVGLYDGPLKSSKHQFGSIHVTTHRLFYVSDAATNQGFGMDAVDDGTSLQIDLLHVAKTEYYSGFLKSSAKITLHLAQIPAKAHASTSTIGGDTNSKFATEGAADNNGRPNIYTVPLVDSTSKAPPKTSNDPWDRWECTICGHRNPPGLSPAARSVCSLCGMPRESGNSEGTSKSIAVPANSFPDPGSSLSSSLPATNRHTPVPDAEAAAPPSEGRRQSLTACPACTFLNHPSLKECEICGTPLQSQSMASVTQPHFNSKSAPASRPGSPEPDEEPVEKEGERYIKLSFRKGGDKAFYATLRRSLLAKGWEIKRSQALASQTRNDRAGIGAILENVESTAKSREATMESAFADLEALMRKAKAMVTLAKDLNDRLTALGQTGESLQPEEATFVRSSLSQLGFKMQDVPLTQDMIKDERKWIDGLGKELAGLLQPRALSVREGAADTDDNIMKDRGIVALDEVWGGWNRARGVALVPPETLLQVLNILPSYTSPSIKMRKLASGLAVIHTPQYSTEAFSKRLVHCINESGPRNAMEISQAEHLSIFLTQEMVDETEARGDICRDEGSANTGSGTTDIRWYVNAFRDYTWDGQLE